MFQTIIQKIIFAITIVLCLGLISCGETNKPIDNKPIVINIDDNEPIVNPVATMDDDGRIIIDDHFIYDIYDVANGAGNGARIDLVAVASDLIVVTEVKEIDNSKNPHTAYLTITETLYGSTNDTEIQINTNRFSKNEKYIFFLRKNGDRYILSSFSNGLDYYGCSIISLNYIQWVDEKTCKDDIISIMAAYSKNKELFSKDSKQDVFQLYPQLKGLFVKIEVLFTIWCNVGLDKQDIPVLREWRETETNETVLSVLDHFIGILEREEE